ncbi:MAG: hypothetical protein IJ013_03850 [Bacteroidaceae bacterium]|nr:hypothetical protein [Bacteroidaceae bacterium]
MEGLIKKKTVYLTTLENLFQELTQPPRSISSGGRKLAFLSLLYDVHRVHQFFLQIENNLSKSVDIHNILLYDADVDYNQWHINLNRKFDVSAFYMPDEEEKDADESSVKETLSHLISTLTKSELKGYNIQLADYKLWLESLLTSNANIEYLTLALNESISSLRESLLHIHSRISKHKMNLAEGERLYEYEKKFFISEAESKVVEKFEEWKDSFDENEDALKRNLTGKYRTEMLNLFMSGFLSPRIGAQVETDTTCFDAEFEELRFFNIPQGMDTKLHYSALRELFDYKGHIVVPKTGHIGKYFFKHRKEISVPQRIALFEFIKMIELIEGERKNIDDVSKKKISKLQTDNKNLFNNIIQYEQPEILLEKLHQLIDGRKGADVGCVLLKCLIDGYITRRPTQKEFKSEFTLNGRWTSIHNYMDDNSQNALDRANKIIIF